MKQIRNAIRRSLLVAGSLALGSTLLGLLGHGRRRARSMKSWPARRS